MNSPEEAIIFAGTRAASGAQYPVGNCLGFTRDAFGSPATGGDAAGAYQATTHRHTDAAPPGYPLWWTGGSAGHGHVAISDTPGYCWSTDFGPDRYYGDGRVRRIPVGAVAQQSSLIARGWSEDLDGELITEAAMILVQKKDGGPTYHYTGNHIEALTDHMALRALGLGAKKVILNDTDEIFSLGPPTAPATATSTPHAHTHPLSATTGVGA